GPAGFGLRRTLVDEHGNTKATLARGEHKSIQTDRVLLTPGPGEEVAIIREVYRAFVHDKRGEQDIAYDRYRRGIHTDLRRAWTRGTVHQLLTHENSVGDDL